MTGWTLALLLAVMPGLVQSDIQDPEDRQEVLERIEESRIVFEEIMDVPDKAIPRELLSRASCVVIIPSLMKGGFIVGAQYGRGVMTCRGAGERGWTGPSTVRVEGGSFGFQIGGASVDLVMLVMNERGAQKLMDSEFTLGGDITVAGGPVGRSAQAETDALLHAEILSYSRSRGVFAGVTLEGATLRADEDDNAALYGANVSHREILTGQVPAPEGAGELIQTLNLHSSYEGEPR